MRIQHNIMAMNSYRNYTQNTSALAKNLEKLSSGYKINRAGDDAAGLAISEKMRAQITGLKTAQKNAKDGISLVQTAEGALTEVHSMLNRMVELADQSANGTYDDGVDRTNLQKEFNALRTEIDRIADSSNFNGIKLLNGDRASYTAASSSLSQTVAGIFLTGGNLSGLAASVSLSISVGTDGVLANITSGSVVSGVSFEFDATAAAKEGGVFTATAKVDTSALTDAADIAAAEAWQGVTLSVVVKKQSAAATSGGTAVTDMAGSGKLTINAVADSSLSLQIGDTSADFNQLNISVGDMHAKSLGLASLDISTQEGAQGAVDFIRNAINLVSATRGDLGALQNRLDHTINNLSVMTENIQDAESSIRDVDVAEEMMAYTKNNILVQSAQAMLAQANQVPQGVLQLLQ